MESTRVQLETFLDECIIPRESTTRQGSTVDICEKDIKEQVLCSMDNKYYTMILQCLKERTDINERFISCITSVRKRVRHRIVAKNSYSRERDRINDMEKEIKLKQAEVYKLIAERTSLVQEISRYKALIEIQTNGVIYSNQVW